MTGATNRLSRLLTLVPWLLAHPGTPVGQVAAEFGVSERQLRDDLRLVWMCGLPGHGPGDLIDVVYEGDRVTLANTDTISRPLRLTVDEALALVAALRALAAAQGPEGADAVTRALAKVESAAGEAAAGAGLAVAVETAPDAAATVQEALRRGVRLHLRYYVPTRDELTERDVDPIRLVLAGGHTYLEAYCHRVEDVRLFRLDRIHALSLLAEPATPPPDAGRDLSGGLFHPDPTDPLVTLELDPVARWVADYYPCESAVPTAAGGVRVELRTPETEWVARLVLGLGGHARVSAPAELAGRVQELARTALAAYG